MVAEQRVSIREADADREQLRILLLEDNTAEARLLQERLQDLSGTIECDVASELWEVSPERLRLADCAVLDLGLPDSSGLEALDWIRDLAPEIPIVVLTGLDDQEIALAALRQGAQEYLLKQHADANSIASAIRSAIVRMRLGLASDYRAILDIDRQNDLSSQLYTISLAMQATRDWTSQPSVVARIADHIAQIQEVIGKIHGTIDDLTTNADRGSGPTLAAIAVDE